MLSNYKISALTFILVISITALGCEDTDSGTEPGQIYQAELTSLNDDTGGIESAEGTAEITVDGDQLSVRVDVSGIEAGMLHPQHIHATGSCPTTDADENNDGFVDVVEGVPSYGDIFIPLDSELANLNSQTSFPNPDNSEYEYTQSVSISELEAAIDGELNLDGRHIVVHGVSSDVNLPQSVQSINDQPANLTLPIACGTINEIE